MLKKLGLLGLPFLLLATPASAISSKEKMETCKIGADSQQLTGAKRNTFIRKCMAKGNYEPQARKDLKKKTATMKKTAKKPAAAPATVAPAEPKQQ